MYSKNDDGVNQRRRNTTTSNNNYQFPYHLKEINSKQEIHGHNVKENRLRIGYSYGWSLRKAGRTLYTFLKRHRIVLFVPWCISFFVSFISIRENADHKVVHPIVIGCHFSVEEGKVTKLKRIPLYDEDRYPSKRQVDWTVQDEDIQKSLRNSKKYDRARAQELVDDNCTLPYQWQTTAYYPTCNAIHENDMTSFYNKGDKKIEESLLLLDHGFFRDIWVFKNDIDRNAMVLKTLRHAHELTERNFNRHKRDALVMEQLTSSDHVAQIYSFCGNSIFSEYATHGTVSDIIWPLSGANCTLSSIERLQLALKVALAVNDVHMYDTNGTATVAHTDLTPSQFLVFGDKSVKLNDFNRCRFLMQDKNGRVCSYRVSHNPGKFRSPEEYNYLEQTEKVDIYSMGNIFYSILTEKWPFEDIADATVAQERIKNGQRPAMQDYSHDKALLELAEVVNLCWKQNATERPIARDVVSLLETKLKKLLNK